MPLHFLDMVKAFIVPHASALFNIGKGQAYAIRMRQEAEKERLLLDILLLKNGELHFLVVLSRDEGLEGVIPITPIGLLAQRRKEGRPKGEMHAHKGPHVDQLNTTC